MRTNSAIIFYVLLRERRIPMLPFLEIVADFLKLVELCKGLVVLPCLIASMEMNGKSRSLGKWVTQLVGKGRNLCRV
jgi:hypothetical protein